ncbi:MAG: hypothetical protein ACLQMS_02740 [Desulfomonilaceae bacterium]
MVTTHELSVVSTVGLRDCDYEIGPFITLVDGPGFEFVWAERRELVLAQAAGSSLVALSRSDMLDTKGLNNIKNLLSLYSENLIELSSIKGIGIDTIMKLIDFVGS